MMLLAEVEQVYVAPLAALGITSQSVHNALVDPSSPAIKYLVDTHEPAVQFWRPEPTHVEHAAKPSPVVHAWHVSALPALARQ